MVNDPTNTSYASAPKNGLAFGHFIVPRREDGSLWKLGEGNMGITYRAFDTSLRVEVALKVITTARVNEEEARRRFQREARAAAKIQHPNVARVLYLGEEGGEFFYAMEFIAGSSLATLLKESKGPLRPILAVAFAGQVASALNAAHRREVVHRDLKPANLMLLEADHLDEQDVRIEATGHRLVKVIDFGLARSFGTERPDESLVTRTGSGFIGTPAYASPEQVNGDSDIDGRSDLYSLGVILWEMLAGKPPFSGKVVEVLSKHLFLPPPLEHLPSGLPAPLMQILSGLLIKDVSLRWPQTASELCKALDSCLSELTGGAGESPQGLPDDASKNKFVESEKPAIEIESTGAVRNNAESPSKAERSSMKASTPMRRRLQPSGPFLVAPDADPTSRNLIIISIVIATLVSLLLWVTNISTPARIPSQVKTAESTVPAASDLPSPSVDSLPASAPITTLSPLNERSPTPPPQVSVTPTIAFTPEPAGNAATSLTKATPAHDDTGRTHKRLPIPTHTPRNVVTPKPTPSKQLAPHSPIPAEKHPLPAAYTPGTHPPTILPPSALDGR